MNKLFFYYILTFPLVHAFAISGTFNFSIIVSLILLMVCFYNRKANFRNEQFLLIIFIFELCISDFINLGNWNEKMLNHSIAWISSIILFCFVPSFIIKKVDVKQIPKYLYIILIGSALFAVIEFIDVNFLGSLFINKITRPPEDRAYDPIFLFSLIRSRSFFAESGYFAMFTVLIAPVYFYFENKNYLKIKNITLIILLLLSMLLAFSTTFFILLVFWTTLIFFIYKKKGILKRVSILLFIILAISLLFPETTYKVLYSTVLGKFESSSFTERVSSNDQSLYYIFEEFSLLKFIFGYGPGSYAYLHITPSVSVYINLLRDLGVLGLTIFILFLLLVIRKIVLSKSKVKIYLMISMISSLVFLQTNTAYYYAFFWFIIVLSLNIEIFKKYECEN